jgi:hypothetical protein
MEKTVIDALGPSVAPRCKPQQDNAAHLPAPTLTEDA